MLARKPIFPNVIEMNFQAGQVLGCCVYLVFDGNEWMLIDIGFDDTVDEIVELIRQMDFPLSKCKMLIATHADVDHIQGLAKAKQLLKAPVYRPSAGHRPARSRRQAPHLRRDRGPEDRHGDAAVSRSTASSTTATRSKSAASSSKSGSRPATPTASSASAWATCSSRATTSTATAASARSTPTTAATSPRFIKSLQRIRDSDVKWLLPSHGPYLPQGQQARSTRPSPASKATSTWPTSAPAPSTGRCWTSGSRNWRRGSGRCETIARVWMSQHSGWNSNTACPANWRGCAALTTTFDHFGATALCRDSIVG